MLEISAALLAGVGAVVIWAGISETTALTARGRCRLIGLGVGLVVVGALDWALLPGISLPYLPQPARKGRPCGSACTCWAWGGRHLATPS
jgi:hypothetical protein